MVQGSDSRSQDLAPRANHDAVVGHYPEDEISLFDLWDVLIRRWYWIAGMLLVTVLLGLAYALMRNDTYEYTYTIEIGERLVDGEVIPIASPEGSAAKLENNYIPAAIREFLERDPDMEWNPTISASANSDAGIVIIRAEGPVNRKESLIAIMEEAGRRLEQDHARRLNAFREQLEAESERAKGGIDSLEREIKQLQEEIFRVEGREEKISAEVEALEQRLTNRRGGTQGDDTAQAVSYLMLVDRLRDTRGSLHEVRADLRSQLEEARQEREELQGERNILETRQRNLTATAVLSEPQQSLQPVGTGKTVIAALSVVLGGMLGMFAAFFAEFVHAANRRRREGRAAEEGAEV